MLRQMSLIDEIDGMISDYPQPDDEGVTFKHTIKGFGEIDPVEQLRVSLGVPMAITFRNDRREMFERILAQVMWKLKDVGGSASRAEVVEWVRPLYTENWDGYKFGIYPGDIAKIFQILHNFGVAKYSKKKRELRFIPAA